METNAPATPQGGDIFALYITMLLNAFGKMRLAQSAEAAHGNFEASVTEKFLERLLFTASALRVKFLYSPVHGMQVDMSDSGFPNQDVIASLETDLRLRDERLTKLQPESLLKSRVLDHMMKRGEEPNDLMWQLADRTYFEMISDDRLFLPFTPGVLVKEKRSAKGVRSYIYSWACYDFMTNRPYIHVLSFDQDADDYPLDKDDATFYQFLHVVKAEGSRAPDVSVLAIAIDSALNAIHPKALKRVCIGPLYSPLLIGNRQDFNNEAEAAACSLIAKYGKGPEDFFLFFTHELVVSERQVEKSGLFGKRVREIFHIPTDDPEAYKRRASNVFRSVLMPHIVRQNTGQDDAAALELGSLKVLTYDQEGTVHGT